MKTIATFLAGLALGGVALGIIHTAHADAPGVTEKLMREQVQALDKIGDEIRQLRQDCGR